MLSGDMNPSFVRALRSAALLGLVCSPLALAAPLAAEEAPEAVSTARVSPLNRAWNPDDGRDLPVGGHRWTAAFRARYMNAENLVPLGVFPEETLSSLRLRTQVSLEYRRSPEMRIFAELVNEAARYTGCDLCDDGVGEVVFENLYLEAVRPWGLPLSLRAGRQDLFYGDGFLVADGTPLDESRTSYVNGVVVTSAIPLWAVEGFWAHNPRNEDYLPRINNRYTPLVEGDETVWGIVASRRPSPGTSLRYTLEPYYIYKRESDAGQSAKIHTLGARVGAELGRIQALAEGAYQGGKVPEGNNVNDPLDLLLGPQSVSAAGGHARLEATFGPPANLHITAGYLLLSGDEVGTRNKFEGWNPILGRWPMWSEVFTYALAGDAYAPPMYPWLAYWQNLAMPFFKAAYAPLPGLTLEAGYQWLDALDDRATEEKIARPDVVSPKHRGEIYQARVSWRLAGVADGHVLFERFSPGAFYPDLPGGDRPGDATYLRLELSRRF